MKCPVCDGKMTEKKVPFPICIGNTETSTFIFSKVCNECGYDENDKRNKKLISTAISETLTGVSRTILKSWKEKNRSFSEIERSFLLPARTLSKWLNNQTKPSAAASELLRFINAFPWMEKAADLGIETEEAQCYVRNYYVSEFNDFNKRITYESTAEEHIYTAVIKKTAFSENDEKKDFFVGREMNNYISIN